MPSSATVDAYSKILGEQDRPEMDENNQQTKDRKPHTVGFEDISEIWDPLVDDSSDSDNEVIKTSHLRPRPRRKRADKKFGDISLLLRRKFAQHGEGLREKERRLEVQSTQLQAELRRVLEGNSGDINWDEDPIKIRPPYQVLFHGRGKIEAIVNHNGNGEEAQELHLVHDFIHRDEGLRTTLKRYSQCVPHGQISFDILWTIYIPTKILVYVFEGILECCRCVQVSDLMTSHTGEQLYQITVESINFNGSQIGKTIRTIPLMGFKGVRDIYSLPLMPLDGHPQEMDIRALMTSREAQFQALIAAGYSHKHYQGLAWVPVEDDSRRHRELPTLTTGFQVNGRVVVDYKQYLAYNPDERCALSPQDSNNKESDQLLCPARIPGFSLLHRRWGWFLIDDVHLKNIEWKSDPFQYLVMEESKKMVIEHLVKGHMNGGGYDFDDLVAGKGRGLIILLRGAPGLGKTLTAECISEHARCPLYRVTAGELTIDISILERTLQRIFELGKRWKAILLLDEADALMCPRKTGAIEMNSIIAAFLQVLEYYEGFLFLTTNKPDDFDEAVKDRVHLEVTFEPMTPSSRRIIWRNMINSIPNKEGGDENWTKELYDALSQVQVNGREIKNILRLATCYASGTGSQLAPVHLKSVIEVKYPSTKGLEVLDCLAAARGFSSN